MRRDNKGLFIPEEIMEMDLSLSQKVIFSQICFRARLTGVCSDTNEELADALGKIHAITVSKTITKLLSIDAITVSIAARGRRDLQPSMALRQLFFDVYADVPSTETGTIPSSSSYRIFSESLSQGKPLTNAELANDLAFTLTNGLPGASHPLRQAKPEANPPLAKDLARLYIRSNIKNSKKEKERARFGDKSIAKGGKKESDPLTSPAPVAAAPPVPLPPPYPPPSPQPLAVPKQIQPEPFKVNWAKTNMPPENDEETRERLRYWKGLLLADETYLNEMQDFYGIPDRATVLTHVDKFLKEVNAIARKHKDYYDFKDNLFRWMRNRTPKPPRYAHNTQPNADSPRGRANLTGKSSSDGKQPF